MKGVSGGGSRRAARVHGVARWKLVIGFAASLVIVSLLRTVHGGAVVAVLAAGFAVLGLAGWLWGCDSRDGSDWKPVNRP